MKKRQVLQQIWWYLAAFSPLIIVGAVVTYKYLRDKAATDIPDASPTPTAAATVSPVSPTYTSTPNIPEIVTSLVDLTGVAQTGAKWGINTMTGQTFLVDSLGNWQAISHNSVVPITAVFSPETIANGQTLMQDVTVTGIEIANHYSLSIITPLDSHAGIDIKMMVVADDKVRVSIVNETGRTLSLPALTISALKLN